MRNRVDDRRKQVVVLDTSAFLAGFDPFSLGAELVTVPKVEAEIQRKSIVKTRFSMAVESGRLKVRAPSQEAICTVEKSANKVGDSFKLSETDMELLALAIDLKGQGYTPQIVTDDYSIQNVATQVGVEFCPLATFGIKRLLEWVRYCPACHREYPAESKFKECQICGTELRRKPRRITKKLKE